MSKETPRVTVKEDLCQGCGLCVTACPKKLMQLRQERLNAKGFHPAGLTNQAACTSCASCAVMCPETAVIVTR